MPDEMIIIRGSGKYKADDGAFLFSLVRYGSLEPTMMKTKSSQTAIYCHPSYGPTFGSGHDLAIANNPNSSNCSVNIGTTYDCPPGQSGTTFLTGNQNFTVSEIEVFEHLMDDE
ncbi:hypothetical protein QZH41_009872 [Actinostola sp. cb2023]|nr:hypothetical protein QZH41_009872 [Actinostola sp. cb2023]